MSWKSLPLDIEQSTKNPDWFRISCRHCEMYWVGLTELPAAEKHCSSYHPDKPWCGHRNYANGHCAEIGCPNYYMKHWEVSN